MAGQLVYHWKHGWIPLTHAAALSKAHGSHTGAAKVAKQYGIAGDRHAAGRFKVEKSKHLSEGAANSHHVVDTHAGKVARDNKGQLAYFSSSTKAHEFANELNAAHHQGLAPSPAAMDAAGKRHIEETVDKPRAEAAKRSLENAAKIEPGSGAAPSAAAKKGDAALLTVTSHDSVLNGQGGMQSQTSVTHRFAHVERVDKNGRVTHVRDFGSHIVQPIEAFRDRRSGQNAQVRVIGQDQVNIPSLSAAVDSREHRNFFHGDAGFTQARDLAKAHQGSTPQRIVDVPAGLQIEKRGRVGSSPAGWHIVHTQSGKSLGVSTSTKAAAEDVAGHLGRTGVNWNQPEQGLMVDMAAHKAAVNDVRQKASVKHGLEPLRAAAPAAETQAKPSLLSGRGGDYNAIAAFNQRRTPEQRQRLNDNIQASQDRRIAQDRAAYPVGTKVVTTVGGHKAEVIDHRAGGIKVRFTDSGRETFVSQDSLRPAENVGGPQDGVTALGQSNALYRAQGLPERAASESRASHQRRVGQVTDQRGRQAAAEYSARQSARDKAMLADLADAHRKMAAESSPTLAEANLRQYTDRELRNWLNNASLRPKAEQELARRKALRAAKKRAAAPRV